jgi:hypothetical protein
MRDPGRFIGWREDEGRERPRCLLRNERGQSEVEFAIVLPLFLGIVFAVLTFAMMMILNEMTYYATFIAARVASVGGSGAQIAAAEILPGIEVGEMGGTPDEVSMHGRYRMRGFLTGGGGALKNPFADDLELTTQVALHRWSTCTNEGDNTLTHCP